MSPDKLDRLREKVLGGTNPKLFVPLSDEYKSLGMTAAAIHVLEHCIETYPNFMSARVALGNLYMEKGCFIHAIEEFKSVTEAIADNILSHRKLAELYTIIGETENALLSYKTILSIDPSDEDAAAGIEKIINEVRLKEQSQQEAAADNPDIPVEAISETSDIGDEYELTEGIDIEDGEETVVIETEPSTAEFTPEEATPIDIEAISDEPISETIDIGDEYELPDAQDAEDSEETMAIEEELLTAEFTPDEATPIDIEAISDEPISETIDIGDEYELPDAQDAEDSEETMAIEEELLTEEFTPEEATPIDIEAISDEPISETIDIGDEYELPDAHDAEGGEETVAIEEEPLTEEFTPEETTPVDIGDEYELSEVIDAIDTDEGQETVVIATEPSTDETIPVEPHAASETKPISATEQTRPPARFNPVHEYELPPDIDIDDTDEGEETAELEAEASTDDEFTPEETMPVETHAVEEAELLSGVQESEPPAAPEPEEEYELPADIDDGQESPELKAEPSTDDEFTPVETQAVEEAELLSGVQESEPPAAPEPEEEYEFDSHDIEDSDSDGAIELNAEPLVDELIPIDTISSMAVEAEPDFGIRESTPPAPFSPVDEYELPADIDIDDIYDGETAEELKAEPLADEFTPEERIPIDTISSIAVEAEPDFGIREFTPPAPLFPVGQYEPHAGGHTIDVLAIDTGQATLVPRVESATDELSQHELIPVDSTTATDIEPLFGLKEATPSALFNPVEDYELPPDIDSGDTDAVLKVQPLTYISTPESTPIDTINEATTEIEPDLRLEETSPPTLLNPVEESELTPDTDGGEGTVKEQLKAVPLTDDLPPDDTTKGAATEAEPALAHEETSPPTLLNLVEEAELTPDIDGGEGAFKLKMESLTDELIPIDTAKEVAVEVKHAFGLEEFSPTVIFSPVEEYELPADIDSDVNDGAEGMPEEMAIKFKAELSVDNLPSDYATIEVATEAEPALGLEEMAPPDMLSSVEDYELSPDIITDDAEETAEEGAFEFNVELSVDELPLDDTSVEVATEAEPALGREETSPTVMLSPVEEYELPPDVITDDGEETAEKGAFEFNTELSVDELPLDDTSVEVATGAEHAFGLEETAPPDMLSPVEDYESPPDVITEDGEGMPDELAIESKEETLPYELHEDLHIEINAGGLRQPTSGQSDETAAEILPQKEDAGKPAAEGKEPDIKETSATAALPLVKEAKAKEVKTVEVKPAEMKLKEDEHLDMGDKPFTLHTKIIKNKITKRVEGKVKAETIDKDRVWLMQELDMIDSYIITEHYLAAIKAFQRLLERYPGDEEILKRLDDIKHMAKFMDRDDNSMIRKLKLMKDKLKERKE